MAKKTQDISPAMPKTIRLQGGMLWNRKTSGVPGYESECKNYDILCGNGYVVLTSIIHDPIPGDTVDCWRKRFNTIKEAMEQAEGM